MTHRHARRTSAKLAAYHEAGHAVAAYFLPLTGRTTRVTIRDEDLEEGDAGAQYYTRAQRPAVDPNVEAAAVRTQAIVALAGPEVDRRLTGNALTSGSEDYAEVRKLLLDRLIARELEDAIETAALEEGDFLGLDEVVERATDTIEDELKREFEAFRAEASELVEQSWGHIEAVARALLERGVLSGDEVDAIIESGVPDRAPRRATVKGRSHSVAPAGTK